MNIVPTVRTQIGGGKVEIRAFGAQCEGVPKGFDWSLRDLKKRGDEKKPGSLPIYLSLIAQDAGITELYAPSPAKFNATLCEPKSLKEEIDLGHGVTLFRGVDASGCRVPKGAAYIISSADCPTWAMYHQKEDILLAGHGGLRELVDYDHIVNGKPEREWENVIRRAFWYGGWMKDSHEGMEPPEQPDHQYWYVDSAQLVLASVCGVAPKHLVYSGKDAKFGENNKKLIDWLHENYNKRRQAKAMAVIDDWVQSDKYLGMIDLHEIIRGSVCDNIMAYGTNGIPGRNFMRDLVDTYGDVGPDGDFLWHSNARSKKLGDGTANKRNLVLVAHQ